MYNYHATILWFPLPLQSKQQTIQKVNKVIYVAIACSYMSWLAWQQYLCKLISHIATHYMFYVGSFKMSCQNLRLNLHRGIHTLHPCKHASQFVGPNCQYLWALVPSKQCWLGIIIIGIKLSILMWRFLCVWPLHNMKMILYIYSFLLVFYCIP